MPHTSFEVPFIETEYHVTDLGCTVYEGPTTPAPPLPSPVGVIRSNQEWGIIVKWTTEGTLVPVIPGEWHLNLNLEAMGPGTDLRLPAGELHVPLHPGPSPQIYEVDMHFPTTAVPVPPHETQAYKLVATITHSFCPEGDSGPSSMAGYHEGQIIQFYNPAP
jgi:hypothetical protein